MFLKCGFLFVALLISNTFPSYSAEENPRRGIDHIDPVAHKYSYAINYNGAYYSNYGYYYEGTVNSYTNPKPNNSGFAPCDASYWVPDHVTSRTITTDIREAILDHDRFTLALCEYRFGDAWRMGLPNEQGQIWKTIAVKKAKSKLEKLVKQSVVEGNPLKLNQAIAIMHQFDDLPPYEELNALRHQTEQTTKHLLSQYSVERRVDAEAEVRILRNITSRLFG